MTGELRRVDLWLVRVAMRVAFETAHGVEADREVVVIRCRAHDGVTGWGEVDSLSHPTYTHEYASGAFALLSNEVVPALLRGEPPPDRFHPMARAGLRSALLDADLRRSGQNLATILGGPQARRRVERSVVLGLLTATDELLQAVADAAASGASLVKLKLSGTEDLRRCRVVRDAFPDLALAADANGSLDGATAPQLLEAGLDELALTYLEQPFPAESLLATADLRAAVATPIALDESINSLAGAQLAQRVGALDAVNIKPARLGGPIEAARLARWAQGEGIDAFCGGMLELGIGRAVSAAVASLPSCNLPTDLGPSAAYVARDLCTPVITDAQGHLVVPTGAGNGVEVSLEAVEAAALAHRMLERG